MIANGDIFVVGQQWIVWAEQFADIRRMMNADVEIGVVADLERQAGLMAIAQTDARKLLVDDPTLEGPRGRAARTLLWLMSQEEAIRLISVG